VVRELMTTAVGDPTFRPGMVAVVQTHGDMLGWHPHVHAIATRGGWDTEGSFVPMPFVSTTAAERLFRHKVITLLRDEELSVTATTRMWPAPAEPKEKPAARSSPDPRRPSREPPSAGVSGVRGPS